MTPKNDARIAKEKAARERLSKIDRINKQIDALDIDVGSLEGGVRTDDGVKIPLSPDVVEYFKLQEDLFEATFGRPQRGDDPLFWRDVDGQPAPIDPNELKAQFDAMISEISATGALDPAYVFAIRKTGRIITKETWDLLDEEAQWEWEAALDEYYDTHPPIKE
ncbi:hypothetical protein CMI47_02850 [Candidatus Pacearchaeota archaeon]|nr:hypothetical protein [Candidatus Pacearchaeota archaeon]|tara:strand:+ start:3669 stop:4160 length:492 start_codon:yes stop_codon:yes gene_type:complete